MFTNRGLALGFAGWLHAVSLAHSQERKKDAMKKALSYLVNGTRSRLERVGGDVRSASRSSSPFAAAWPSSFIVNLLAAGLGGSSPWRHDDPMAKALRHLINREMSRGWVGWHTQWEEKRAKMESMRRSLGHALNRQLSAGWGAWVEMAVDRAEFMRS